MLRCLKEVFHPLSLKLFFSVAAVVMALNGQAQALYSTNAEYIGIKPERNNLLTAYRYRYPDTTINNEHNYFPRNFMGNLGLPSPDYILNYGAPDAGFIFFRPPTRIDRFTENDIEYYRTKGPYARLTGVAGSKQLQLFKMLFTTTYKGVNVTLRFHRYTSQGFYLKQQTYSNNFFLTSNYTDKRKRLGYYVYVLNNSNKNQENNGIRDSTLKSDSELLNKELLPVNTSYASRDNRETKVMLNPWFRLNAHSDSLKGVDHFIQVRSKLAFNLFRYSDNLISDSAYVKRYPMYIDTALTFDSSHVSQYSNEVDYVIAAANKKLKLSVGYRNELSRVYQHMYRDYTNHMAAGDLVFRTPLAARDTLNRLQREFETAVNAQYVFAGANSANYKAESNSLLILNAAKKRSLYLNALFERRNPDYIYNNWISNHFQWFNNGYAPQEQLQAKAGIQLGRQFSASVFYQSISNYLYFNRYALPAQYQGTIANYALSISYENIFFKYLGVGLAHTLQNTSHAEYVRIPPQVTTARLFLNASLFRNNMQLQIGGQLQVYQPFYGYAYMAPTQVFYLQDAVKTSPYPYLDLYLNARIRPVSVFLKVENALQGYAGNNYFFVPGYYQPDRAFRFGISWMFFD